MEGSSMPRVLRRAAVLLLFCSCSLSLAPFARAAQTAGETIRIDVDATRAPQKILHSHLEIPVKPGALALYYPQWIPGEHSATGPIINLAGLKFVAAGKTLPWRRDLLDSFT